MEPDHALSSRPRHDFRYYSRVPCCVLPVFIGRLETTGTMDAYLNFGSTFGRRSRNTTG